MKSQTRFHLLDLPHALASDELATALQGALGRARRRPEDAEYSQAGKRYYSDIWRLSEIWFLSAARTICAPREARADEHPPQKPHPPPPRLGPDRRPARGGLRGPRLRRADAVRRRQDTGARLRCGHLTHVRAGH